MKTRSLFSLITAWCTRLALLLFLTLLVNSNTQAQPIVPFTLSNNSQYADANIYVAVVGIINDNHVWIDTRTGAVHLMNVADNTVPGPVYNGDLGPGGNGRYANCFARLSEIPNKTINIPGIEGCRMLISFNSQLYLYFFGASGAPSGYAAPNLANPNDPNQGIRFEMIELTNAANGLWANTTRVDGYQFPMGLEVWGNNAFYQKVGEFIPHDQVLSLWQATAPADFAGCYDAANGIIKFPSKTPAFQGNGAQAGYFNAYIDAIWSRYRNDNLVFNSGDAGTWSGRVSGDAFIFTRASDGQVGTITRKPTNTEAMEGSGVLAAGGEWDKVVQAQVCAAINRHAIDLSLPAGAVQDLSNASGYYQASPYNWYCKFWHRSDISLNGLTYAFCYDDVFNHSSTINAPSPLRATVTIGGFAGSTPAAIVIQAEDYEYMSGIDVEATTDAGGGRNVGWIDAGDWMSYQVTIPVSGAYRVEYRVASPNANTALRLEKDAGATQLGSVAIPNTGGWQQWSNVSHTVTLPAGTYSIGIATATGGFNLNYLTITSAASSSARLAVEAPAAKPADGAITLWPNPAGEQLYLRNNNQVRTLDVYDINGRRLLHFKDPGSTLSLSSLAPGIYVIAIGSKNGKQQRVKIVKQ
ncbi:beta-1,3-glucanase family protein [Chitinophaga japonensis]|uniref:Putative secreted protein (Por secretion system target) n=1 Tax=Chitinophaga japonensis TaxID=104662 RepID=A0A562TFQ0_CHIJA|nr:beta-1,3-glucanase family protein [Chitinophaga japonensis]TWI92094.1 putative secreted protein (Por secretion system target) [Chitinophaga japonensis]